MNTHVFRTSRNSFKDSSIGWPTLTVIYTNDNEDQITIHEAIFEEAGTYKPGYA